MAKTDSICSKAYSPSHSKRSSPMKKKKKKKLCCRYCDKKFHSYQALGGHQNAHKTERAATQKEQILSMSSAYDKNNSYVGDFLDSNKCDGFRGKAFGVSALSMTHFKPQHSLPHIALNHDSWSGHYTLDYVQATMHKLETLIAEGSGFHQHHKSYQPLIFPTLGGGEPSSQLLFNNPGLCDKGNFWQAKDSSLTYILDLNVKSSLDDQNSAEQNTFSPMSANGEVEELDLTLKI